MKLKRFIALFGLWIFSIVGYSLNTTDKGTSYILIAFVIIIVFVVFVIYLMYRTPNKTEYKLLFQEGVGIHDLEIFEELFEKETGHNFKEYIVKSLKLVSKQGYDVEYLFNDYRLSYTLYDLYWKLEKRI